MFTAVKPQVDIPQLEQRVLQFWRDEQIFERSMSQRQNGPSFVFYEGPPTANGRPGSHHVISRAFKDMFPRYRAMTGCFVLRKGGWDTHGLPVEMEVEKQLGLTAKPQIEAYGVAAFNQKCRESVFKYIQEWEELTERIAYWVDLKAPYVTYQNEYIESVWWILRQFFDRGLLYQDYKIVPYSPRSGTPYSSHEVSLGYKDVDDPSVFVRFPVKHAENTAFLVWTTTPWTLPANVALAVGADIDYVLLEGRQHADASTERLYVAAALVESAVTSRVQPGGGYAVVQTLKGRELLGMRYERLFADVATDKAGWFVVAGDFVSTSDGTGIVHLAPAFGADDLELGRKYGLPVLMTVDDQGKFLDAVTLVAGLDFKAADKVIIRHLKERGLMFHAGQYRHSYPHCWRDGGPLMYLARTTWYLKASAFRDRLVALNQQINWVPSHVRDGRFGKWLEEVKDWAIGRNRYWGTPLPIWVCDNPAIDHRVCVQNRAELSQLCGRDLSELDLHRPYVDEITWEVEVDGQRGTMRRVPEVIDVWFDSGAMPFAQWGYPFHNRAQFEAQFPADYICEAVDQTRGWFYSLHAISTLLRDELSYRNVICLGHILDAEGRKMSKSRPETFVAPWDVLNKYGADAFRWYMYTAASPGEPRRFSVELVGDVVRSFYLTLWNVHSFFTTYAALDGFTLDRPAVPLEQRDFLDRWLLSELQLLIRQVTAAYEAYDAPGATQPIADFVEKLSNWYLRRSRRRFWQPNFTDDKAAAYQTLYVCLTTVAKLLAPSMPFLAEQLHQDLVARVVPTEPVSVHLCDWPAADASLVDEALVADMAVVATLVQLGHAARNQAGIKVRQPLALAQFALPSHGDAAVITRYADLMADELNVKQIKVLERTAALVEYKLKPVDTLGRELRTTFPAVRQALVNATPAQAAAWGQTLLAQQAIEIPLADGQTVTLTSAQVVVQQSGAAGFEVAEANGCVAALQTALTPELRLEGLAREVIRRIQQQRKDQDLHIADRIRVVYAGTAGVTQAIAALHRTIADEVLAVELVAGAVATAPQTFDGESLCFGITVAI